MNDDMAKMAQGYNAAAKAYYSKDSEERPTDAEKAALSKLSEASVKHGVAGTAHCAAAKR